MKRAIPVVLLVIIAGVGWVFYSRRGTNDAANAGMKLSGNVEAHQSLVGFKVAGRIVELPVEEGQTVAAGQLLARLEDDDYRQQVAVDQASERVRESQLSLSLAGPRAQDLKAAYQSVLDAEADLAQKKKDFERYDELFKKDEITGQTRDQAETNLLRSKANRERVQQTYDALKEGTRKEQIAVDRANLQHARTAAGMSRIRLGHTELKAPAAGVVLVRQAELGEVVNAGAPIVTLADLDHLWVRVYVPETQLGKLRLGQRVSIATDSHPGKRYPGRVSFISSEAEFTPRSVETQTERVMLVYRVKVDVENPEHELKPGMPADVFYTAQ